MRSLWMCLLGVVVAPHVRAQAVPHPFTFSSLPNLLPGLVDGSARWADIDRDGDLDLMTVGTEPASLVALVDRPRTRLFRNDGVVSLDEAPGGKSFAFTEVATGLPDLTYGEAAFADVDRDGDLDLFLTGSRTSSVPYEPFAGFYRNTNGRFTAASGPFAALHSGTARWADLDRDGDLDLVVCGSAEAEGPYQPQTFAYFQGSDGSFSVRADVGLPGLVFGRFRLVDLTNDGIADFIGEGLTPSGLLLVAYRNDGTGRFTLLRQEAGGAHADVEVADVNGDGTLDIFDGGVRPGPFVFAGTTRRLVASGTTFTVRQILNREGMGTRLAPGDFTGDGRSDIAVMTASTRPDRATVGVFETVSDTVALRARLMGDFSGALAWGDVDGDADLDLVASYNSGGKSQLLLYRNERFDRSQPPPVPAVTPLLSREGSGSRVEWAAAAAGVTYDVRIGTAPGRQDIRAAEAAADGRRLLATPGPFASPVAALAGLPGGTYYVGLQTVGADLAGSAFAEFPITLEGSATAAESTPEVPFGFSAASPVNAQARLHYRAPASDRAWLRLYDLLGREVLTHELPPVAATTAVDLDVAALPSGLYIARLTQGATSQQRSILVVH